MICLHLTPNLLAFQALYGELVFFYFGLKKKQPSELYRGKTSKKKKEGLKSREGWK